jgi:hypothetical protein
MPKMQASWPGQRKKLLIILHGQPITANIYINFPCSSRLKLKRNFLQKIKFFGCLKNLNRGAIQSFLVSVLEIKFKIGPWPLLELMSSIRSGSCPAHNNEPKKLHSAYYFPSSCAPTRIVQC